MTDPSAPFADPSAPCADVLTPFNRHISLLPLCWHLVSQGQPAVSSRGHGSRNRGSQGHASCRDVRHRTTHNKCALTGPVALLCVAIDVVVVEHATALTA